MNHIFAIAIGGACGAVLRYLVSSGIYHWLGRDFPYGTLGVNVIGSFLLGLLTEALVLNRVAFSMEYRSAILVGFIGAFTTFSTFSLETVYLLEQHQFHKAILNVFISVVVCLVAIWGGLLIGRTLANLASTDVGFYTPFIVNAFGAILIALIAIILLKKISISVEYQLAILTLTIGLYLTLSSLYVLLYEFEKNNSDIKTMLFSVFINIFMCLSLIMFSFLISKKISY